MHLLSSAEYNEMIKYLKWKVNKMCVNKFNKPNCSLRYSWNIMEMSNEQVNGSYNFETLEYAINTIREVNGNHKAVFERVQELSWTTMLELNGIISQRPDQRPDQRPEDVKYKQVFTDVNLLDGFALNSSYMHPLNYKTVYYYNENKVFFLEDIIANCALECDGEFSDEFSDMKKFKGLPFYAVVPIEITSYPGALNSSLFLKILNAILQLNNNLEGIIIEPN